MSQPLNRLSKESSPYLLQHASNPVDWYPWGDEAFEKAKQENKLMLISIGYSSCHWCHVMEREAFSNVQVAEFMNSHYVCVKVDREERPDVDQIYMNAVQIITRSGGWPLNCFALPDGRPVYGGTYFPDIAWLDILKSLHFTWMSEPKRVNQVADELIQGISQTEIITKKSEIKSTYANSLMALITNWQKHFDERYGGLKGAPKFPMPKSLKFLMHYAWAYSNDEVRDHVAFTLRKISQSGIYDHIGGGFFRYSVDEMWHVPHFEKMLYDNALMMSLYAQAYRYFKDENYKKIVYQTVDFLKREMRSPEGGFYSAIDADSEGEEGRFYTFLKDEVDEVLGEDAEMFSVLYGVSASGNLNGRSALRLASTPKETACVFGVDPEYVIQKQAKLKQVMLKYRNSKVRPSTDDKQILSWNALTIKGLIDAYITFNDESFLDLAIQTAGFIEKYLINDNGSLTRIYCKGKTSIAAFLDDYAFLIDAYILLYQATFNEHWLLKAKTLTDYVIAHFYCEKSGMFYFTNIKYSDTIVRKMELTDGVIPSSGAVMAHNLQTLGAYFLNDVYGDMAKQMGANISGQVERGGPYIYKWASLLLNFELGPAKVFSSGDKGKSMLDKVMSASHRPNVLPFLNTIKSEIPLSKLKVSDNMIRLCVGSTCRIPTNSEDQVILEINEERLNEQSS